MDVLNSRWVPWTFLAVAGFNSCIGNLFLKHSRLVAKPGFWPMVTSPWLILGLCFYGINVILFAKALDKLPVSVAYPVFAGVGFVFVAWLSNLYFGESLHLSKIIGMILILGGITVLSFE
ncbi:MAG: multidrug efflux SMR transporter [Deltaproteobacteria bacterium]|jgi:multidrug transporter EmrE-like cation transporter|nr:multidrug efflux SMR transporter [Deltaproteobacteria bacterium]